MIMRISVILLFLLSIAVSSSAEIYKYRDANGVLRFTNKILRYLKSVMIGKSHNITVT